ncbi:nucleotidyltransferase family protein [Paenibacillus luteus]|uniref:nucleotidyltransferase family protein n=1 Tax=Paenibacillus luteus TaxID=2545753 RepID=UPI0030C7EFBB
MQNELSNIRPDVPWEATNQAAVHLWYQNVFGYPVAPLESTEAAIYTWPETATSVGVKLLPNDDLQICAP